MSFVFAHFEVKVIKITPKAFEPSNVTVDENSTLIFINQDTIARWPASDFHPTHEVYPEFDPKGEIAPGESWSFKPKKPGVWNFHDHLDPHVRGVLTVNREAEDIKEISTVSNFDLWEKIKSFPIFLYTKIISFLIPTKLINSEDFKKLNSQDQFSYLTQLSKDQGGKYAWEFLTTTYQGEAGSSGSIHDLAHLSGKLLYESNNISGISFCTQTFSFGCYHGLLDRAFRENLASLPQAEKECEKVGKVNSGPFGSCIHGIGHGVASFHKLNNLEGALKSCDRLTNGRDFCYDGIFMEFVRGATPDFYQTLNPLFPCDMLEEKYGSTYSVSCGRNAPSVFIGRLNLPFEESTRLCGQSELDEKFKSSCFDALGFMLASTQDTGKIIEGCKKITSQHYLSLCLKSAAGELIFQEVPGWDIKAPLVCEASPDQGLCQQNLERLIKEYDRAPKLRSSVLGEKEDDYVTTYQVK